MSSISDQMVRPPTISGPDPGTRSPSVPLPVAACDCHAHVFGPQRRFPYLPGARYIPPDALPEDYLRMLTVIGCQRAVLVQPTVYGTDNSCMVSALTSGLCSFRGVAVVDEKIADAELDRLHQAGVRGVRVNATAKAEGLTMAGAPAIAGRIKRLGWHLQFLVHIDQSPNFERDIANLPVPCVIDHFAHVHGSDGPRSTGFQALLGLARMDHVWFKLTGAYRISTQQPLYPDVAALAQGLLAVAPDRCVWGTDWPHPNVTCMPNDGDLADAFAEWVADGAVRHRVLVDNPARLYGFA